MYAVTKMLFLAIFASFWSVSFQASSRILTELDINNILPSGYNKALPKNESSDDLVVVNVHFMTLGIKDLNLQTMEFSVDFELTTGWHDYRLNIIEPNRRISTTREESLQNHFWIPHIEFLNDVKCNPRSIRFQPSHKQQLDYLPVAKYFRLKLERQSCVFTCHYDLRSYPFDEQTCSVEIIHKDNNKNVVYLQGVVTPLDQNSEIPVPPAWELIDLRVENCSLSAPYSCTEIVFVLKRLLGHHILTIFAPSVLIVIISWTSFTMNIDQPAPRVALGLTTLLTLSTQFLNAQKGLPVVAYVKSIDLWMIACMLAVFLNLIEFSVANYVHRRAIMKKVGQGNNFVVTSKLELKKDSPDGNRDGAARIDRVGGSIIAITFTLFVIVFWAKLY